MLLPHYKQVLLLQRSYHFSFILPNTNNFTNLLEESHHQNILLDIPLMAYHVEILLNTNPAPLHIEEDNTTPLALLEAEVMVRGALGWLPPLPLVLAVAMPKTF